MKGPMHAIHNARIQLLATLLNNAALAFIVAAFIAPAAGGQLQGGWAGGNDDRLGHAWSRATFQCMSGAREFAMRWDQTVTWLILPAIVALVLGGGGIWLSRRIP
jgi:hypothetical protein